MNEERRKVLQMVAEGRVTPEQANQLLEALGGQEQPTATAEPVRQPQPRSAREWDGFASLTHQQMIEARMHEMDAAFIREMGGLFDPRPTFDELVEAKIHDLDPEYIREMRACGLRDASLRQLIEASIHDLDPEYVREMRAAGLRDLSVKKLVEMKIHEIDAEYFKEMNAL